jgi:NitT/TauT family transport system permease protein
VAEVATIGDTSFTAFGLGAYMTKATIEGHWPGIVLSIVTMCVFVVATNRFVWRRLYLYAEDRLKED